MLNDGRLRIRARLVDKDQVGKLSIAVSFAPVLPKTKTKTDRGGRGARQSSTRL